MCFSSSLKELANSTETVNRQPSRCEYSITNRIQIPSPEALQQKLEEQFIFTKLYSIVFV